MIINVRDGAKAIIRYALEKVVENGDIRIKVKIQDNDLAEELDFDSSKRLKICIQYLAEKGLIKSTENGNVRYLMLTAAAIDFLEEG